MGRRFTPAAFVAIPPTTDKESTMLNVVLDRLQGNPKATGPRRVPNQTGHGEHIFSAMATVTDSAKGREYRVEVVHFPESARAGLESFIERPCYNLPGQGFLDWVIYLEGRRLPEKHRQDVGRAACESYVQAFLGPIDRGLYRKARGWNLKRPAMAALADARGWRDNGTPAWAISDNPLIRYNSVRDSDGGRFVEAGAYGLRFVRFADETARRFGSRSIEHTGWYMEDDGWSGDLARGCVYQLPGKNGRARYVPAYTLTDHRGEDMQGGAVLYFDDIIEGESGLDYYDSLDAGELEAAQRADHYAERLAERERDYRRAWQAGQLFADTLEEIETDRRALRALLRERRDLCKAGAKAGINGNQFPATLSNLKASIRGLRWTLGQHTEKLRTLKAGEYESGGNYYGFAPSDETDREAFNDGAGIPVIR